MAGNLNEINQHISSWRRYLKGAGLVLGIIVLSALPIVGWVCIPSFWRWMGNIRWMGNMRSYAVYYLYKNGSLSYFQALALSDVQIANIVTVGGLESVSFQGLDALLPAILKLPRQLTVGQIAILKRLYPAISNNYLTMDKALSLTSVQQYNVEMSFQLRVRGSSRLSERFTIEDVLALPEAITQEEVDNLMGFGLGEKPEFYNIRNIMEKGLIVLAELFSIIRTPPLLSKLFHLSSVLSSVSTASSLTVADAKGYDPRMAKKIYDISQMFWWSTSLTLQQIEELPLNGRQKANLSNGESLKVRKHWWPYDRLSREDGLALLNATPTQYANFNLLKDDSALIPGTLILKISYPLTVAHRESYSSMRAALDLKKLPPELFLQPDPLSPLQIKNLEKLFTETWRVEKNNYSYYPGWRPYRCVGPSLSLEHLQSSILLETKELTGLQASNFRFFYKNTEFLGASLLSPAELLALDQNQAATFRCKVINRFISAGQLTIEKAKLLREDERLVLQTWWVSQLIHREICTVEQMLHLAPEQRNGIFEGGFAAILLQGVLPLEIVLLLIRNPPFLTYYEADHLTPAQEVQLVTAYPRIVAGEITTLAQLGIQIDAIQAPAPSQNINQKQSTHTVSVHLSVSDSAKKLDALYGSQLTGGQLEKIIAEIKAWLGGDLEPLAVEMAKWLYTPSAGESPDTQASRKAAALEEARFKLLAAKRGVSRVTAFDYAFVDSTSKVSTQELLALIWLAIHDETDQGRSKEVTADSARFKLVMGLHDLQRTYNLNEKFEDDNDPDDGFSCLGGTFNKLVESINAAHPAVSVKVETERLAILKFPMVVAEAAESYLLGCCRSASPSEIVQLLDKVAFSGCGAVVGLGSEKSIYEETRETIKNKILAEFKSVYVGEKAKALEELVDSAEYGFLEAVVAKLRAYFAVPALKNSQPSPAGEDPETVFFKSQIDEVTGIDDSFFAECNASLAERFGGILSRSRDEALVEKLLRHTQARLAQVKGDPEQHPLFVVLTFLKVIDNNLKLLPVLCGDPRLFSKTRLSESKDETVGPLELEGSLNKADLPH